MRVLAASDFPLGSPRAHAINVVKTAGGFQRLGHAVRLLCAAPEDSSRGRDPVRILFDYAEPTLAPEICPASPSAGRDDAFAAWVLDRARAHRAELVYARHFAAALACAHAGFPTVLETHAYIDDPNPHLAASLQACGEHRLAISTISRRLAQHYIHRGASPDLVSVIPDGVDIDAFSRPLRLPPSPLPDGGPHAVYCGHLYDYKGIPQILAAAASAPGITFHLVGGLGEDIARVAADIDRLALSNVVLHGRVPHAWVPPYLWHADVLLLPPSAREPSKDWTSPVKLGEYLASGTPIVCSNIPALRDWLGEEVHWCAPDDGPSLAHAVRAALAEPPSRRAQRAESAHAKARACSYRNRAAALLSAAEPLLTRRSSRAA